MLLVLVLILSMLFVQIGAFSKAVSTFAVDCICAGPVLATEGVLRACLLSRYAMEGQRGRA